MTTTAPVTLAACPSCGHAREHSPLIGCLYQDGQTFCDCQATWEPPKTHATARAERDEAMERVQRTTDPDWATAAHQAVADLALGSPNGFTSDDVWDVLRVRNVTPPQEPRALGPVL